MFGGRNNPKSNIARTSNEPRRPQEPDEAEILVLAFVERRQMLGMQYRQRTL